jgi:hypothetical protein
MTFCARCCQMAQRDTYIWVVMPVLVSFGSMTRVQYHVLTSIVQTCFISPYFTSLAQHPVLKPTTVTDHHQMQMILTMSSSGISRHTCYYRVTIFGGEGGGNTVAIFRLFFCHEDRGNRTLQNVGNHLLN